MPPRPWATHIQPKPPFTIHSAPATRSHSPTPRPPPTPWGYSITIPAADVKGVTDPTVLTTGSLTFDGNGALVSPAANPAPIPITGFADGANHLSFTWNMDAANKH